MAFFTLVERKLLASLQLRKGPNKVSIAGLLQPIADVIKLFTKSQTTPHFANTWGFLLAPGGALLLSSLLWSIYPHSYESHPKVYRVLFFLMISRLTVYPILMAGWSSNSKYALLGALRGVAQTVSYEIRMALTIIVFLYPSKHLSFRSITHSQTPLAFLILPLVTVWFATVLAETHRPPFDFVEGESELVSGYNVEYSGGRFAIFFIAEYMAILIICIYTSLILFNTSPVGNALVTVLLAYLTILIRATLPRMRYDQLINLTWKRFLPIILALLILRIFLSNSLDNIDIDYWLDWVCNIWIWLNRGTMIHEPEVYWEWLAWIGP